MTEVLGGIMGDISIHSPSYEDGGEKRETFRTHSRKMVLNFYTPPLYEGRPGTLSLYLKGPFLYTPLV